LPDRRAAALTLGEWVDEYLDAHQGERVTVAKLRWLLGKATCGVRKLRSRGGAVSWLSPPSRSRRATRAVGECRICSC
jgi:hypothetical protein